MNLQLFAAFLLITLVLIVTPGPIVTLVIATGATRGTRAALTTVAGTTVGNAMPVTEKCPCASAVDITPRPGVLRPW